MVVNFIKINQTLEIINGITDEVELNTIKL